MNNHQLIAAYCTAHRAELLAFVSSRIGDACQAEDVVQDVFLRLLTGNRLISEVTLPSLVYTTARHLITDYWRCKRVREEYEHYLSHAVGTASPASPESVFSARQLTERMERGLARLPEQCREVYRLHIYGGLRVSEISQQLGQGYKSVEHRLGTARKAMRQYLRRYA